MDLTRLNHVRQRTFLEMDEMILERLHRGIKVVGNNLSVDENFICEMIISGKLFCF